MNRDIAVRLFGALRRYGTDPTLTVSVPDDATVADLRRAFAAQLKDDHARALLKASAFATDQRVLNDAEPLPRDHEMAVLPPVSGG
jgi:molybdopterin converting factor small subunit